MAEREHMARVDRKDAEALLAAFVPMFEWFDKRGIDYCLVGGLAVLLQGLRAGAKNFRATVDADIMFDTTFTNVEFARAYLDVYASNPRYSRSVYDAVFGEGAFEELSSDAQSLVNVSLLGADSDIDGISTPDFDVVRKLNGVSLADIEREEIDFMGHPVKVATARQLLLMKERTIGLLHAEFDTTPRPQDFIDVARLREIVDGFGAVSGGLA
jgi:hypothetical protein